MKLKLISIAEAAGMLGIGRTKAYELISLGKIERVKIGRRSLIRVKSIKGMLDESRRSS